MSTLGPQCLQCKKRRVKCDSTEPTCNKCEKDGYDCPGYTKSLTWVHVKPKPKVKKKLGASRKSNSSSSSGSSDADSTPSKCLAEDKVLVQQMPKPEHALIPDADRRAHAVLDAVFYYNTELCPDLSAVHWLGKQSIDIQEWLEVPATLQNMVIVSVLSTKALRFGCETKREMYTYRGLVLSEMGKQLQERERKKPWMPLSLVLSMLSLEVYLSPIQDFKIHLDAARLAVASHGGVAACMRRWPAAADMISLFIFTEVISTTTTAVSALQPKHVSIQSSYLYALENFEDYLLDSVFPCPVSMFEAIIRINGLRLLSRNNGRSAASWQAEILHVLEDIQSFNPWQWANQLDCLSEDGERLGSANEWATLASCYQASSVIYLIESMRSQDLLDQANMERLGTAIAHEAWMQLHHDLRYLHTAYPLRQATPGTPCLWRFCLWPLIVHTYGTIALSGLECTDPKILSSEDSQSTIFDELRQLGVCLASHALIYGANMLERLAESKSPLSWDEAFVKSGVFYV